MSWHLTNTVSVLIITALLYSRHPTLFLRHNWHGACLYGKEGHQTRLMVQGARMSVQTRLHCSNPLITKAKVPVRWLVSFNFLACQFIFHICKRGA